MRNSANGLGTAKNVVPDGYDYRKFANLVESILHNEIMEDKEKEEKRTGKNWLLLWMRGI